MATLYKPQAPVFKPQNINVANAANDPAKGGAKTTVDYASVCNRPPISDHILSVYHKEALRQLAEDFPRFHKLE
jgi:hypothetical protein